MADREKGCQSYIIIHLVFGCLVQCRWIYPNTHLNFLDNQYQHIKTDLYGATLHRGRQNTDIVSHVSVLVSQKAVTQYSGFGEPRNLLNFAHLKFCHMNSRQSFEQSEKHNIILFYQNSGLLSKRKYFFWIVNYFLTISSVTNLYYMGLFEKTFILTVWHYFEQPDVKNE